jgi:N6-L-threonylcarbamoyladenine synthase
MKILSIESSCDDTSAAVLADGVVKSNVISSQNFHTKFGGIIPELASRAHLKAISPIVRQALSDADTKINEIEALAVTANPGLVGSLIVGSNFAKGLSVKYKLPIVPINHIEGHLYSGCLQDENLEFPFVSLVVSGGHTNIFLVESYTKYEIIGSTRDDAAGEAFDKIAKLMNLGYPGGPVIDRLAKEGNPKAFDFPRPMIHEKHFDFSFSGLKTSVRYFVHKTFPDGIPEEKMADLAASVQAAIVDVLVTKTVKAARENKVKGIVIAGGVSANSGLRSKMAEEAEKVGLFSIAPEMQYCMDNAAMIAFLASKKIEETGLEQYYDLSYTVNPSAIRAAQR